MKVGLKIVSQSLRPDGWPPTRTETHAGQLRSHRCKRRVQPTRSTGPGHTTAADDGGGTTDPASRPIVEGTKSFSAPFDMRYRRLRYPSLLGSGHVSLGLVREATPRHGRGGLDPARRNGGQQLLAPLHRDRTRRPLWELSHLPRKDKSPVRLGEDPPRRVDQPNPRGPDAHHSRRRRRRTGGPRNRERGPGTIRGLEPRRGPKRDPPVVPGDVRLSRASYGALGPSSTWSRGRPSGSRGTPRADPSSPRLPETA